METFYKNGSIYHIEHRQNLSSLRYTKRYVYYIYTDQKKYDVARRDIENIMKDSSWDKSDYVLKNKNNPSMENGLHPYHEFKYDEEKDVFIYTLVIPYDD